MLDPLTFHALLHPFACAPVLVEPTPSRPELALVLSEPAQVIPDPVPVLSPRQGRHPLREARLKLGYTQQMLADFALVSLSTIERAERGERIRVTSMHLICQCFSERFQRPVTPDELGLLR
jgi:DNA-binding XRE family transcriptional regulator